MADSSIVTIKKGNGKELKVTEKAFRVLYEHQGYKKVTKKKSSKSEE